MMDTKIIDSPVASPPVTASRESASPAGSESAPAVRPEAASDSQSNRTESATEPRVQEAIRFLGSRDASQDRLQIRIEEDERVVVQIVDAQGEVVRQVPPKELVELSRRLDEVIGLLFDKTA